MIRSAKADGVMQQMGKVVRFQLRVTLVALLLAAEFSVCIAQTVPDAAVREALVGSATLADNVEAIVRRVQSQPAGEQFDSLVEWVFPHRAHHRLRLDSRFVPTGESGIVEQRYSVDANLLSPALLLVDLAAKQDRLGELRQRLAEYQPVGGQAVRTQHTMKFLIELAAGNEVAARTELGLLYDAFAKSDHYRMEERWPETVAATRGVMHPGTRSVAGELIDAMTLRLTGDVTKWRARATPEWELHLRRLGGYWMRVRGRPDVEERVIRNDSLRNWAPGCRQSGQSLASGYPQAVWIRGEGGRSDVVRHVSGHWRDYLWYRSPLTGNYEVECEVSAHAWHEVHLMAAGAWCGLKWDGRGFSSGSFRLTEPIQQLEAPMAKLGLWSRLRAVVRDGVCTTYFNGRKLQERSVTQDNHPWVALRAGSSSLGAFRDVRITGAPEIPERLELIRGPQLTGWNVPLAEAGRPEGVWVNREGELVGTRRDDLLGTTYENLLSYCRPMLEDGEIEYEFLYEPGRVSVSPVIGLTAFLMEPGGVRLHRVTGGRFDRSELQPANRSAVLKGSKPSLIEGEWNRVRLVSRGDVLTLELNGEEIVRHTLTIPDQRSFGLFHFADQTEARVRNIVWRGDWPKELLSVSEQELAAPEPEYLAGLERLKEVVTFDFSQSIPTDRFDLVGTIDAEPRSGGLLLSPPVRSNWSSGRFTWKEPIYGDFDISLRVSGLKQEYGEKGTLVVELAVVDDAATVVGCVRSRGAKDKVNLVAKKSIKNPNGTRRYSGARIEDELEDGILRIVRRGAEIHSLASHGDSPNFRHVGSNRLPSVVSPVDLQIVVASTGSGHTEVVVHELTIRSNSEAVEERLDPNVLALDQYVAAFRPRVQHDFADDGLTGFSADGPSVPKPGPQGLVIRPSEDVMSVSLDVPVTGEFDVSASLELVNLPVSDNGTQGAELSLVLPGGSQGMVELAVFKASKGVFRVEARLREGGSGAAAKSDASYTVIASAEATSVEQLRVIRIQQSLLFVFSEGGVGRLLGQTGCQEDDLSPEAVSLRTRLSEKDGPGSEVRWKQFSVSSAAGR